MFYHNAQSWVLQPELAFDVFLFAQPLACQYSMVLMLKLYLTPT